MEQIRSAAQEYGAQYGVEHIYLFGSYARGEADSGSDVDLRVDKGRLRGLFQFAGLKLALEDRLGTKVDLLASDCLDKSFLNRIRGKRSFCMALNERDGALLRHIAAYCDRCRALAIP